MSKIKTFTLGADPELFLFNRNTEDFHSVEGLIGGTKEEPIIVSNEGFMLQEDNVMVEYNIPPAHTKKEFIKNNQFMLEYIETLLPDYLSLKAEPSAVLPWDQLLSDQALTFGCSADLNAWTGAENEKPQGEFTNLRSAGGHIHIGYDEPTVEKSYRLIKCLDIFLGVPLSLIEPENKRKELYGKAGACRLKSFGVEYRTPSNYWLTSEKLMGFVYEQVELAIKHFNDSNFNPDIYYDTIIAAINQNNKDASYYLVESLNVMNLELLKIN